jgi:hypothetical protein
MSSAARYLWHQRLAWLLMIYATAIGATISPEFAVGRLNVSLCLNVLMVCAIVMACVKDSVLCGRSIPYSWRLPMAGTWPLAVPIVEWRARRWWGLAWVALHGLLVFATLIVTQLASWLAAETI